jgi:hypothetical protein
VTGYPNEVQVSRNIEIKARTESADAWVPKIADDELTEVGVREARELMEKLDSKPHQMIDEAYLDRLARRGVD